MNQAQPSRYLQKIAGKLFVDANERAQFIEAIESPHRYAEAILWLGDRPSMVPFEVVERLDWQPDFVDRIVPGQRPGAQDLHQRGAYYCLDLSSVFAAQVFSAIKGDGLTVLDLCASPGGKSVCAFRMLQPQILVCNETIGKRLGALTSNLKRCVIAPSVAVSRDPKFFAQHFASSADVVIVDAPCSGQSLLRKGQESAGCFHPATVNLNKNRQRRIIAEASSTVAPGGYLAYMTCTFSIDENEEIVEWFLKRFPDFQARAVPLLSEAQSHISEIPCYRLWPQQGIGAGSFAALLQRSCDGERQAFDWRDLPILWSNPESLREESKHYRRQ